MFSKADAADILAKLSEWQAKCALERIVFEDRPETKLIGQAKLTGQALLCFATYNLVRMGSIGGWWDAHHA